jgi:hypothetical protein
VHNVRARSSGPATSGLRRAHSQPSLQKDARWGDVTQLSQVKKLLAIPKIAKHDPYNEVQGKAFGQKVMNMVNDASTCLLISIGSQLNLFAAMSKQNAQPQTAQAIASIASNIHVRYVEEWLQAMTCIGIVEETNAANKPPAKLHRSKSQQKNLNVGATTSMSEVRRQYQPLSAKQSFNRLHSNLNREDSGERRYMLPPEHALFLTWETGAENLALVGQYIPVLGRLEEDIVSCFRTGSGMDWTRYWQCDLITELDTLQTIGSVQRIETELLGLVPVLANELREGINVLCLGSSMGRAYVSIARAFPKSWFTLYDTRASRLGHARRIVSEDQNAPTNLHFAATASGRSVLEEERTYDAALILDGSVVRDSAAPSDVLRGVRRSLRPGRSLVYLDLWTGADGVDCPGAPLQSTLSAMQAVPLGLDAGGPALGRLWGVKAAQKALIDVGFARVSLHRREKDDMNCVLVATVATTQ